MGTLELQSANPWTLLDTGLWFIFVVWSIAFQLCRDDPRDGDDQPGPSDPQPRSDAS